MDLTSSDSWTWKWCSIFHHNIFRGLLMPSSLMTNFQVCSEVLYLQDFPVLGEREMLIRQTQGHPGGKFSPLSQGWGKGDRAGRKWMNNQPCRVKFTILVRKPKAHIPFPPGTDHSCPLPVGQSVTSSSKKKGLPVCHSLTTPRGHSD